MVKLGGSYMVQTNGDLERVEFTAPATGAPVSDPPADPLIVPSPPGQPEPTDPEEHI